MVEPFGAIVEPFGAIVVCMQHSIGTSHDLNFVHVSRPLPLVFHDQWGEVQQPSTVDVLERSPSELSRLVGSYFPRGSSLVACSISMAILTILLSDFQGSEIIAIDNYSKRASFLYNELSNNFQGHLLIPNRTCGTNNASDGVNAPEDTISRGQEEDIDEDEYRGLNVKLPCPYGSDKSTPDTGSVDNARSSEEEKDEKQKGEDEDVEVGEEDTRDVVLSTPPPLETTLGETLDTVALAEEGDAFASQISEMEKEASNSLNFFSVQMRV